MLLRKSDVLKTYDLGGAPSRQTSSNFQKSYCNLKIRSPGVILCVAFLLFVFWKQLLLFKVKESMLFVEQKYKLDGIQISNSFREMNFVLQIKIETVMNWSSQKKKECIFCNVCFVRKKCIFYLNLYYIE